jgi:hypothetical protein
MLVCNVSFVDRVSRKTVYNCIDAFGRMWEASNVWTIFRDRVGEDWKEELARREAEQALLDTEGRSGSFYNLGKEF